jgi:excisionase family DNA binding protein
VERDLPLLLTFGEVAAQLGVSEEKVKSLVREGELPAVTVGVRSRRVRRADLLTYVQGLAS